MLINKEEFISLKSRSQRFAVVSAHWPHVYENGSTSMGLRIGVVVSFHSK